MPIRFSRVRRFEAMVAQWKDRIYSFAHYSLHSREEAEDVTQDVLVRLWQHWDRLDPERTVPWLIRVTRNACLDVHRQRQSRHTLALRVANDPSSDPLPGETPDRALERGDSRRQIEDALREIDEPYRTIIVLREIENFPYAQIASALGLPLGTVKVYLHRGRRMLRERMREVVLHDGS